MAPRGPHARTLALVLALATLLGGAATPAVHAQTPEQPDPWFEGDGVVLDELRALIEIRDGLATTTLTFRFHNEANETRPAALSVPLPPLSTLHNVTLDVDATLWEGAVLERRTAQISYDDAVESGDDAALISVTKADVSLDINVRAGAERTLTLAWLTLISLHEGAHTYRLDVGDIGAAQNLRLDLHLRSSAGLATTSLTALQLKPVTQTNGHHHYAYASDGAPAVTPNGGDDLVVHWTEGIEAWLPGIALERRHEDGSGCALVTVAIQDAGPDVFPRDMAFVLDTSGSMEGPKIEQARESLREVLLSLRPHDRFAVVTFDSVVATLSDGLQNATGPVVAAQRNALLTVQADGSTDFDGGLQRALALVSTSPSGRAPILVVLSDGMPTQGVRDPSSIVARMEEANVRGATVHVVAIGLDADRSFLADIASRSGGSLTELRPDDDLQERLSEFYATLGDPVLVNVTAEVTGAGASHLLPVRIPDLYAGNTLRLLLRTASEGPLNVTVRGDTPTGPIERRYVFATGEAQRTDGVCRLWGAAHVEALLSAERLEGSTATSAARIVENATTYGVLSPYTSWVIVRPPESGHNDTTPVPPPAQTPIGHTRLAGGAQDANVYYNKWNLDPTAPVAPPMPTGPLAAPSSEPGGDGGTAATPAAGLVGSLAALVALAWTLRSTPPRKRY